MGDINKKNDLNFIMTSPTGRSFYSLVVSPYLVYAAIVILVSVLGATAYFASNFFLLRDRVASNKALVEVDVEMKNLNKRADEIRAEIEKIKETNTRIQEKTGISGEPGRGDYLSDGHHEVGMPTRGSMPVEVTSMRERLSVLGKEVEARKETVETAERQVDELMAKFASIPSINPIRSGRITSGFGYRRHPITMRREFHRGLDIKGGYSTPIRATADGVVTFNGWMRGYGRMIKIKHANGFATLFAHNSRNLVKVGEKVKKGQIIGYVGSTGTSTGPHVHYEVRYKKRLLNPRKFLSIDLRDVSRY